MDSDPVSLFRMTFPKDQLRGRTGSGQEGQALYVTPQWIFLEVNIEGMHFTGLEKMYLYSSLWDFSCWTSGKAFWESLYMTTRAYSFENHPV